jgi:cell division protease FtsH
VAEEIIFGEIATGAVSDLDRANHIARRMVTEFGMSKLGRVFYRDQSENPYLPGAGLFDGRHEYSEQTAREIDLEVRRIVDDALQSVRELLQSRRGALDALAQRLVDKEVIDGGELRALLTEHTPV